MSSISVRRTDYKSTASERIEKNTAKGASNTGRHGENEENDKGYEGINELKEYLRQYEEELRELKLQNTKLKEKLSVLENRIHTMEKEKIRNNLVITELSVDSEDKDMEAYLREVNKYGVSQRQRRQSNYSGGISAVRKRIQDNELLQPKPRDLEGHTSYWKKVPEEDLRNC
ncbi:hypothetical protein ILUMI_07207 [Ignelater luminosus]|uniref:Uncharacterized protein n=1 Tax=Ignelater luminosus TaxID=2038154 RepID=A0A8K0D8S0_IGNLU|nr:hypothetical protein ILUMI_07207 [Ignelater luminosus]